MSIELRFCANLQFPVWNSGGYLLEQMPSKNTLTWPGFGFEYKCFGCHVHVVDKFYIVAVFQKLFVGCFASKIFAVKIVSRLLLPIDKEGFYPAMKANFSSSDNHEILPRVKSVC